MQLSLEWSKKLAGQKHRGKDFGVVFLDVFLLPEFRSGASFSPKNHAEPVLNRMTLLVLNCTNPEFAACHLQSGAPRMLTKEIIRRNHKPWLRVRHGSI